MAAETPWTSASTALRIQSACFTGPRAKSLLGDPDPKDPLASYEALYGPLQASVEFLAKALALGGCTRFMTGGASGFDSVAQRAICHLKAARPELGLKLTIVLPWPSFSPDGVWATMLNAALAEADDVVSIEKKRPAKAAGAIYRRNVRMVEDTDATIALWPDPTWATAPDGKVEAVSWYDYAKKRPVKWKGSGTGNTLRETLARHHPIALMHCKVDDRKRSVDLKPLETFPTDWR